VQKKVNDQNTLQKSIGVRKNAKGELGEEIGFWVLGREAIVGINRTGEGTLADKKTRKKKKKKKTVKVERILFNTKKGEQGGQWQPARKKKKEKRPKTQGASANTA